MQIDAVSFNGAGLLGGVGGPSTKHPSPPTTWRKISFQGDSGSEYVRLITQFDLLRSAGMHVGLGLHLIYTFVAW